MSLVVNRMVGKRVVSTRSTERVCGIPIIRIILTCCADYESIARIRCCAPILQCANEAGGVYLVAIMDWHSRSVLAWRLSSTMDAEFRVAALEEAINCYGVPEIFNRDQGLQFTSQEFTQAPKDAGGAISMDGNGRWMDNLMIKRIWRSVKWECLYLREVETGSQALKILKDWFQFYNKQRPLTAFDGRRLIEVYCKGIRPQMRHKTNRARA